MRCARRGSRERGAIWRAAAERLWRLRPGQIVARRREALKNAEAQLRLLGPEQVLARGYSITMDAESGRVLRESKSIKSGQRLKTRLKIGEVLSRVEES